jgi:hypothetical protein
LLTNASKSSFQESFVTVTPLIVHFLEGVTFTVTIDLSTSPAFNVQPFASLAVTVPATYEVVFNVPNATGVPSAFPLATFTASTVKL